MKVKKLTTAGLAALALFGLASCGIPTPSVGSTAENPSTSVPSTSVPSTSAPSTSAPATSAPSTSAPTTTTPVDQKKEFKPENYAQGAKSYVASSYEERTEILGLLEKYAVKNNLTGLTLFGDGGYVMYSEDVKKGTNTYIPGYGFGVLSEGKITNDLAKEPNQAWKRYYHNTAASDPGTINYMNSQGSDVGDFNGYAGASYWTTQMNETKDGYEWVPELAKDERPVAVNADANGLASKYRFEVKVGNEVLYNTNTTNEKLAKYNGTQVKLDDYLTTYKILFTKKFGMKRMTDNTDGAGSFKGVSNYIDSSAEGINEDAWRNVGIKAYEENGKSYLEFEFNIPCNEFYAMYYLSSSMHSPLPKQFVEDLGNGDFEAGVKAFGSHTADGLTPVDTYLTVGAYAPEAWNKDEIVFKKNPYYADKLTDNENRYQIAGIHTKIYPAISSDKEANLKLFLANEIHACGVPSTQLDTYRNDPRTTRTAESSTFKLNLNSCTQEEWEALFGENGTIVSHTKAEYYQVKPCMSNDAFLSGLSYALNRKEFAEAIGRTPSANYFGSAYLSNPEEGISYNSTKQHQDAVKELQNGTEYGYNLEFARKAFAKAVDEMIADGSYNEGDTVNITITWMYSDDINEYGEKIAGYWEQAFNSAQNKLTLNVSNEVGGTDYMGVYNKMMEGTYDIGFGSISGNSLNPLNFLEVLKSDNSSNFTLNWGPDTSVISEELYYDGCYWSFDSLWTAADQGGYFEDGKLVPAFTAEEEVAQDKVVENADGTVTITLTTNTASVDGVTVEITDCVIFGYFNVNGNAAYDEESVGADKFVVAQDGKSITVTLTKELATKYKEVIANLGIDIYYTQTVCGLSVDKIVSVYFDFAEAEA